MNESYEYYVEQRNHTRIHFILLYFYKVLETGKLTGGERNQNSDCLGLVGRGLSGLTRIGHEIIF